MSYGDEIDRLADIDVEIDGASGIDTVSIDTDGNGRADTFVGIDQATGDHALHAVDETDGSTVTLVYDASGAVVAAAFGDPTGAITEITGPDVAGFLAEFGRYTGTDVPLEVPDARSDLGFEPIGPDPLTGGEPPDPADDGYTSVDEVTSSPGYQDWVAAHPDGVIGDTGDADFWFKQSTDFTCAPAAATQIVEDFLGTELGDESTIARWALEQGLLDEENGMFPADLARTLTHFGVPATVLEDQTWDDVATYLEEGRSVVMMVDSGDYWPGQDDDAVENGATDAIDHAVRIVAIDTERGVAILSDSGTPQGHRLEVPLDVMEEAWNDVTAAPAGGSVERGRILVVSDHADPTDGGATASPLADFDAGPATGSPASADATDATGATAGGSPLRDFGAPPLAGAADGDADGWAGWAGPIFANPAGWVLVPVTLAAARIFATRK